MSNLQRFAFFISPLSFALLALAIPVGAAPINGQYVDTTDCDTHGVVDFNEEIGDFNVFPVDEGIIVDSINVANVVCVGDDGVPNDYEVRIGNITNNRFEDLFFVADEGNLVGNRDGLLEDVVGAPGGQFDAFRIDNVGINQPLIGGDVNNDLIFDPGEFWSFLVTNFTNATFTPPLLASPGVFAGSSTDPMSNASIVANLVVPEPGSLMLVAIGAVALLGRMRISRSA